MFLSSSLLHEVLTVCVNTDMFMYSIQESIMKANKEMCDNVWVSGNFLWATVTTAEHQ
jgi:hypothetical protein